MASFDANPDFEAQLLDEPQMKIAMLDAATVAKNFGNQFMRGVSRGPWLPRHGHQEIEVQQHDRGKTVLLVNTDYAAAIIEWGGYHNPPYAILRRAVRAAGMKYRDVPKGTPIG